MRRLVVWGILLTLAVASSASANMGTPLLWLSTFHLACGNLFIGAIESLVLRLVLHLPYRRGLVLMTLANYFSMLVGLVLIRLMMAPISHAPPSLHILQVLSNAMLRAWVLFFVATVFLEMPFVHRLFPQEHRAWSRTLGASLLAQSVSYPLLVYLYYQASNYSVVTQTQLQPDLRFVQPLRAQVYYIGLDGDVWRIHTDGTGKQKVKRMGCTAPYAQLYARLDTDTARWDLWCAGCREDAKGDEKVVEGISWKRMPVSRWASSEEKHFISRPPDYGLALDYRAPDQREWTVWVDFWPDRGMQVSHHKKDVYSVAMGTPLLSWRARAATCLPGDYAVFQLGDYILILHLPTRRLGFLAAGRSPLVVMPDRDAPEEQ